MFSNEKNYIAYFSEHKSHEDLKKNERKQKVFRVKDER